MYKFSSKLKTFALALMVLGILGIAYGFLTAPKTTEEVETILSAHESHGEGHGNVKATHSESNMHKSKADEAKEHEEHVNHVFPNM